MNKIILSIVTTAFLAGCSQKENPFFVDKINPKRAELKIVTKQFAGNPLRWKETFRKGDEIGLYVLSGKDAHFYTDSIRYKNVKAKATKDANGNLYWVIYPPIYLDLHPVTVIAYYPYQRQRPLPAGLLPLSIAFPAEHTPDYRYGRSTAKQRQVNSLSPIAHLSMKPLLAHLSFRLRIEKTTDKVFHLEAIQIQSQKGTALCCLQGVFDGNTGRIIPLPSTAGIIRRTTGRACLSTDTDKEYAISVLPTLRPASAGEIEVLFTINQQTYTYPLPRHTRWRKGYKYVYEMVFDGNYLSLKQINCQFI